MLDKERIRLLIQKRKDLEEAMNVETDVKTRIKLSQQYAEVDNVALLAETLQKLYEEEEELNDVINDEESDEDFVRLAKSELFSVQKKIKDDAHALKIALLPKDKDAEKNIILEIRAGTGGDEAALFAADLFNMYQRFAQLKQWKFEVIAQSFSDIGGYKEVISSISGNNVYQHFQFESGVHRVQRIPQTESGGRIHTSAATVAVLPEADETDFELDMKDLRIDVFRASGAGGQHVNKTESAVRITHLPTHTVVVQQDEKSQHKNKAKALRLLRARIYEQLRKDEQEERSEKRRTQVGSGDRSERIRTYNYPQGRVTDHRINLTLHKLPQIISGEAIHEIIDNLQAQDELEKLAIFEDE